VLLIDEVDKADPEFPNDLLLELDEMRFKIIETNEEIVAKERPVVLITSNNEKELPDVLDTTVPGTGRDRIDTKDPG
jgi:MoxR-like ATPase